MRKQNRSVKWVSVLLSICMAAASVPSAAYAAAPDRRGQETDLLRAPDDAVPVSTSSDADLPGADLPDTDLPDADLPGADSPDVLQDDSIFPAADVSYESPVIVKKNNGTYDVTFRYQDAYAGTVGLRGTAPGTDWGEDRVKMKKTGDDLWSVTLTGLNSGNYEYKFVVNGNDWHKDPGNLLIVGDNSRLVLQEKPEITDNGDGTSKVTLRYAETSWNKGEVTSVEVMSDKLPGTSWTIGNSVQMGRTASGSNIWWVTFESVSPGTYEYKYVINGSGDGWTDDPTNPGGGNDNSKLTIGGSGTSDYASPVVEGKEVTFRYRAPDAAKAYLAGDMNGWSKEADPMTKGEDGVWIITKTLSPGKYGYKFVVDNGWYTDPKNPNYIEESNGNRNSKLVVSGLADAELRVRKGEAATLPETLAMVDENGDSQQVTPIYTLPGGQTGVTLTDRTVTAGADFTGGSFTITASCEGKTSQVTVYVVDSMYTYHVYFFSWNQDHMTTEGTDLWMWEVGGADGHPEFFTESVELGGHTWLKATLSSPAAEIGLIPRSYGNWDGWKTTDHLFKNTEKAEICDIYIIYGDEETYGQLPELPDEQGRAYYVPGTFPGPSWAASSNRMTPYEGAGGIYAYTFENVPAGNYEFKIAVNGTWDENYGAGGVRDGHNYGVAVPETQDVTVYYCDATHLAATSLTYRFLEVSLAGTGIPEETVLTDAGLTGIYSVSVTLQPGEYNDLQLMVEGDQAERIFNGFTLEEEREITFFYAPAYDIYYHNAAPDDEDAWRTVHYDSRDAAYKSVYGAVATGQSVTFSLDAGEAITGANLVIGSSVYSMTPGAAENGVRTWSATVDDLNTIGEYDYFFVVSQASAVKVYSDDDGYYGTGAVTDLSEIHPYDLVVYRSGYKTPDWMKNAVIYQIFPDRFFNGDPSNDRNQTTARGPVAYEFPDWNAMPENPEWIDKSGYPANAYKGDGEWSNEIYGGDLRGITEKIGYLKELGVTVIYLNPVFASISNHRYDTSDYTKIDPILGDMGDFTELAEAAKANGMHIVLDGVFNHVSDDSIYFDRYYKYLNAGDCTAVGAYPYWAWVYDYMAAKNCDQDEAEAAAKLYFESRGITDFSYTTWFDIFNEPMKGGAEDTIGERIGKPVYSYDGWWGYDSMPIIKATDGSEYRTEDWAETIISGEDSVTQRWLKQGSDGWRLDVANEVSDETWQRFRESVKDAQSDAVIIGEIWDDATRYLMGDMYDSVMNYMFRNAVLEYAKGGSSQQAMKDLERLRERYPQEAFYAMMNLLDSHDTTRVLSYLDGIPDDRKDATMDTAFPTYEGTSDLAKKRQYLAAFLQFTYAGAPTIYYGDERGMTGADDPDDRRTIDWDQANDEALLAWYSRLAQIRAARAALRTGSVEPIAYKAAGADRLLGYVRREDGDALIVLANNGQSDLPVTLDLTELDIEAESLQELISGETIMAEDGGTITVTVPALSGVILDAGMSDEPVKPEEPDEPVTPEEPDEPVAPEEPDEPVTPGEPDEPGTPDEPDTPVTPGESDEPSAPGEPDAPVTPTEPVAPTEPDEPANPSRPGDSGTPSVDSSETDEGYVEIMDDAVPLAGGLEEVTANGQWEMDGAVWRFRYEDGTQPVSKWERLFYNGQVYWYYFDEKSIMRSGWFEWEGYRFYLNPISDGWCGKMSTGWVMIDGKWYYFEPVSGQMQGHLYMNTTTPDGYRVTEDGSWDGKPASVR